MKINWKGVLVACVPLWLAQYLMLIAGITTSSWVWWTVILGVAVLWVIVRATFEVYMERRKTK